MSRDSVNNAAAAAGSGSYSDAFSALGGGGGRGGGSFLSFRRFNSYREKRSPLPSSDADDAPPPPSPEQISYQAVATTGQPEVADTVPILAPPGAPIEGKWVEERYCGLTTWVITLLGCCVCSYFCPCDRRTVWISKNIKINPSYEAVTGQPAGAASPVMAPPGAPAQGMWVEERYCGIATWLICLVAGIPCSYFCPCDRRTVWISNGVKYNERGAVTDDYIFLNPFPPGSVFHPDPDNRL